MCRLVYRISFDEPDDFVDLCLPNDSVRRGIHVCSVCVCSVVYICMCVPVCMYFRVRQKGWNVGTAALTGAGNPAVLGKKGSAFSQRTVPRQSSAVAKSGAAQPADMAMPASISSVKNSPNVSADKIFDAPRWDYVHTSKLAGRHDSAKQGTI